MGYFEQKSSTWCSKIKSLKTTYTNMNGHRHFMLSWARKKMVVCTNCQMALGEPYSLSAGTNMTKENDFTFKPAYTLLSLGLHLILRLICVILCSGPFQLQIPAHSLSGCHTPTYFITYIHMYTYTHTHTLLLPPPPPKALTEGQVELHVEEKKTSTVLHHMAQHDNEWPCKWGNIIDYSCHTLMCILYNKLLESKVLINKKQYGTDPVWSWKPAHTRNRLCFRYV